MKNKKCDEIVYEGLGFPITLVNAPMKKVFGEWVLDINLNNLQEFVLRALARKSSLLTGAELSFIRKHFEMTKTEFGKIVGVKHVSVVKWENNQARISPQTDLVVKLYILDRLNTKAKEFKDTYHKISANLAKREQVEIPPLEIDASQELIA